MHPLVAVIVSLGIIVVFVGGLLLGALWLARRYSRAAPGSGLSKPVGWADLIPAAVSVFALTAGTAIAALAPASNLGTILRTPLGIISAFFAVALATTAISVAIAVRTRNKAKGGDRS